MLSPVGVPTSPLTLTADQDEFSPHQLQALRQYWSEEPPQEQVTLFFHAVVTSRLDPFRQQIRLIRRTEAVRTDSGLEIESRWSIETSIHGFRVQGERAAANRNMRIRKRKTRWYDERQHRWVGVWPYDGPPTAARCTLDVQEADGTRYPLTAVTHFVEYVKTRPDGERERGWTRMPCHLLAKCAEVAAWQKLFPEDLGWLSFNDALPSPPPDLRHTRDLRTADTLAPTIAKPVDAVSVLGAPRRPSPTAAKPEDSSPDTSGPTAQSAEADTSDNRSELTSAPKSSVGPPNPATSKPSSATDRSAPAPARPDTGARRRGRSAADSQSPSSD